ncbi:hypothetical protein CALVIDRAFT_566593 [Calocera viscosa TUFC12733]|uniref:Uncharacterized protein n=1 Tax=Calocera viscosa (strain TUFC12733) TaxID=1330018 RepID=A0A167J8W3_CALVF|nr:hypothetical protein CALVIDRAFT_566593 [Calocera viscosa TUFC12733]
MRIRAISNAFGPLSNVPTDTIKTRVQGGEPPFTGPTAVSVVGAAVKRNTMFEGRKGVEIAAEMFGRERSRSTANTHHPVHHARREPGAKFSLPALAKKWLDNPSTESGVEPYEE